MYICIHISKIINKIMTCKTIFNKYTKVNLLKVRQKCIINHKAVQPKFIDMQLSALLCLLILLRTVSSSKVTSIRKADELTGHRHSSQHLFRIHSPRLWNSAFSVTFLSFLNSFKKIS